MSPIGSCWGTRWDGTRGTRRGGPICCFLSPPGCCCSGRRVRKWCCGGGRTQWWRSWQYIGWLPRGVCTLLVVRGVPHGCVSLLAVEAVKGADAHIKVEMKKTIGCLPVGTVTKEMVAHFLRSVIRTSVGSPQKRCLAELFSNLAVMLPSRCSKEALGTKPSNLLPIGRISWVTLVPPQLASHTWEWPMHYPADPDKRVSATGHDPEPPHARSV